VLHVKLDDDDWSNFMDVLADAKSKDPKTKVTDEDFVYDAVLVPTATTYSKLYRKLVREGSLPARKNPITGKVLASITPKDLRPLPYVPNGGAPDGENYIHIRVGPILLRHLEKAASVIDAANRVSKDGHTWDDFDSWLKDTVLDDLDNKYTALLGTELKDEHDDAKGGDDASEEHAADTQAPES
jgi:hypothetical protein